MQLVATTLALAFAVSAWPTLGLAHETAHNERLPTIGPGPDFALTSQDGARVSLGDFRGKVVAVSFASCTDACPLLTAKVAQVQDELGTDFAIRIAFVSITVDPERDTPAVLKEHAQNFGANRAGWAFLTSTPEGIQGRNPPVWRLRIENGRRRRRSHVPHLAYRPARYSARTIPRSALRPRGVQA